ADATGKGLEGVVAAQTRISDVDGRQGRLFYAGYDIADLAAHATLETPPPPPLRGPHPPAPPPGPADAPPAPGDGDDPAGREHPGPAAGRADRLPGRPGRSHDHPADGGGGGGRGGPPRRG